MRDAARKVKAEPARDAVRNRRQDDLVEAPGPQNIVDRAHRIVPERDHSGDGAPGRILDHRPREREHLLALGMPALALSLRNLGMLGRVRQQQMELRGSSLRARTHGGRGKRRGGGLVRDDEDPRPAFCSGTDESSTRSFESTSAIVMRRYLIAT